MSELDTLNRLHLHRLSRVLEQLLEVNSNMAVKQALTLLKIAEEPGQTMTESAKRAGIPLSSFSRHVDLFIARGQSNTPTFSLLTDDYDVINRRQKVLNLSPDGRVLIAQILSTYRGAL